MPTPEMLPFVQAACSDNETATAGVGVDVGDDGVHPADRPRPADRSASPLDAPLSRSLYYLFSEGVYHARVHAAARCMRSEDMYSCTFQAFVASEPRWQFGGSNTSHTLLIAHSVALRFCSCKGRAVARDGVDKSRGLLCAGLTKPFVVDTPATRDH
ncbi:hypothetical protein M8818_007321 [Zalaria obscura]|uniref:Uncharacterized protein n=1 Tax=Zalaria obscura TaxID=2024903 RepID=A0ACC3S312_9PEZI